ncbi:MAG: ankyrin repeat domain-containing protein, partial [Chlamydiales bacterium]|nr:ankyrin repeat domain-containing protein [Chlamydiales bacterium]
MKINEINQKLSSGLLPSVEQPGKWEKYIPTPENINSVVSQLAEVIQKAEHDSWDSLTTQTNNWMNLGETLANLETNAVLPSEQLAPLISTISKAVVQAKNNLLATLESLKSKKELGWGDMEQVTSGVELLLSNRRQDLFPADKTLTKKIEATIKWIDARSDKDSNFLISLIDKSLRHTHLSRYLAEKHPTEAAYLAVCNDNVKLLASVLEKHPELINASVDEEGNTLLHIALKKYANPECLPLLLNIGASLDRVNNKFCLPMDSTRLDSQGTGKLIEQMLPPMDEKVPKELVISIERLCAAPTSGIYKVNSTDIQEVLGYLENYPEWVSEHPNFIAILLGHVIHLIYPSSKVIEALNSFPQIVDVNRAMLLQQAIEHNRIEIVEHFLKQGVDCSLAFEGPSLLWYQGGKTPIELAVQMEKVEIAELLFQAGYKPPASLINLLAQNKDASNHMWRWLLNLIPDQKMMQKRLEEAVVKKEWGEILYWIEKGLKPADPSKLAMEALKAHQLFLVEHLWSSGLLKNQNQLLLQVAGSIQPSWAVHFFEAAHRSGVRIDRKEFVNAAIAEGNVPLAALLVSQGAPCKGVPYEKEIRHFASYLEGTPEEVAFRVRLTGKNLAHLVGDSFVLKMKDDRGAKLETDVPSNPLDLLSTATRHAAQQFPAVQERLGPVFDTARKYALRIHDLSLLPSLEQLADAAQDLERDILAEIEELPIGQTLLLPGGWPGHSIAYAITKLADGRIQLKVINTGEGQEYHTTSHDSGRMHANTMNTYEFSIERLAETHVIQTLIEAKSAQSLESTERRFRAKDIYHTLHPYKTDEVSLDGSLKGWKKSQLAGTCALRCLLAFLKTEVPSEVYKQVTDVIKEDAVYFAVQQYEPLVAQHPSMRKFLSLAIPHLFDTFGKRLKTRETARPEDAQRLNNLKSAAERLKAASPEILSDHEPLSLDPSFSSKSKEVATTLNNINIQRQIPNLGAEGKGLSSAPPALQPLSLDKVTTARDLAVCLSNLMDYSTYLTENNADSSVYLSTGLTALGRIFIQKPENRPDNFKIVSEQLQNDPDLCEHLVQQITHLVTELQKCCSANQKVDPSRYIAVQHALVTALALTDMMESARNHPVEARVSTYGVPIRPLNLLQEDFVGHTLLNAEWEHDYAQLTSFDWHKNRDPLFNIDKHRVQGNQQNDSRSAWLVNLRILPTFPEYKYTAELAKSVSDWKNADEQLESALEMARKQLRDTEPYIDPQEWRVQWLYANNMVPLYFQNLRRLTFIASQFTPGHFAPSVGNVEVLMPKAAIIGGTEKTTADKKSILMVCYKTNIAMPYTEMQSPLPPIDGLQTWAYERGRNPKLRLAEYSQNHAIGTYSDISSRELMSIRAVATNARPITDLSVPLLIDYYTKNLDDLSAPYHQAFFEATLFSAFRLPLGLKRRKELDVETEQFLSHAIQYFDDRIKSATNVASSVQATVFLTNQYARFLSYALKNGIQTIGDTPTEQLIKSTRDKMREMLADPQYQGEEIQHYLHLALLDSFHSMGIRDSSNSMDVARCISELNLHTLTGKKTLPLAHSFVASATAVPVQQSDRLQAIFSEDPNAASNYLNRIAETYDITPSAVQWHEQAFPIYHCTINDSLIQVNCLSGALLKDGYELIGTPSGIKYHQSYRKLFGDRNLNMTTQPLDTKGLQNVRQATLYMSQDQHGPIHIIAHNDYLQSIHRVINGRWCALVDSSQQTLPPIPPLPGAATLLIWKSLEETDTYYWVDAKTMETKYQVNPQGHYVLMQTDSDIDWEWVDLASVPGGNAIKVLDPNAFLLQEVSAKKPLQMRLQLPNIVSSNGEPLEFVRSQPIGSSEERWVVKGLPHLFLADSQQIPGIHSYHNYLVLEAASGEKEALLPIKTIDQLRSNAAVRSSYLRVQLTEEDGLQSHVPYRNLYLAYLALTHATTPDEYMKAMDYLHQARKFERYDETELQMIYNVLLSQNATKDHTGYAYACRLYTAWLVQDNLKRNPLPANKDESQIVAFFEGRYSRKKGTKTWSFDHVINRAAKGYFERCQHLPVGMRIENCISPRELQEWNLQRRATPLGVTGPESMTPPGMKPSKNLPYLLRNRPNKLSGDLLSRPTNSLKRQFLLLLDAAMSSDPKKRQMVVDRLRNVAHDPDTDTRTLATILHAALNSESSPAAQNIITYTLNALAPAGINEAKQREFTTAITNYGEALNYPLSQPVGAVPPITPASILPENQPQLLPQEIPASTKLPFILWETNIARFDLLLTSAFTESKEGGEEPLEPFHLETDEPWLKASIEELNEDYAEGVRKNNERAIYTLSGKVPLEKLTTVHRQAIARQAKHYEDLLAKKEEEILALANKLPSDPLLALQHQTAISSGRKQPLTIRDCIGLFLQGDDEIYLSKTNLKKDEDIGDLHQHLGEYIKRHNQYHRHKAVLSILDELAIKGEQPALIQQLAEELKLNQAYAPGNDANAMMVFEYSLNLYLHEHQVEGIQDMTEVDPLNPLRFRSKLLQRIQGGGKSLVFGHIMALLKADGYHLSIHVPPTAQYQTALYDMAQRSDQIYGQRERTLVFDDDPLKFTPAYLTSMRETMEEAIVKREYITVTIESLRAMRCKYLKTRFLIQGLPDGPEKAALRKSNQILKEMLFILRSRGIFTFDEVHIALDPIKELNMPYGQAVPPDVGSCNLLNKILQYACTAKDENNQPLLDIKRSSQQTEAQRIQMKAAIIARLTEQEGWEDPAIADFLNGITEDIPYFLEGEENRAQAKLVTLAKQMLHGNWLEERLQKNVDEDHGLPQNTFPRVSIPFIANMKPAEGSEFSDEQVIITNTFIAYLSEGLNKEQTRDCLVAQRKQAFDEKEARQDPDPTLSIQNTEAANKFKKAFGVSLFSLDPENPEHIESMQRLLLLKNEDAIDILLDYVTTAELSHVEIYEHQVCSNGQNTASMSQSNVGYSGSMEDLNMAPIGTEIKPEKGTNGQTIHRLISRATEVILVDSQPEALFTDLMDNHPRRNDVRAIIDVGAHFRGLENEAVAELTCKKMTEYDSEVQGVLFFHTKTGKLCFIHRDTPGEYTVLSGTTPKTIAAETGYKPEQLFTYYDQDHITGTDIVQMPNAIAILTVKEDSEEFQVLQGTRRLRGLDRGQEIITAVSKGAMEKINQTVPLAGGLETAPSIKETLLFTRVQMAKGQKPKNLMFALQKIENEVQQLVLDSLYALQEDQEEALFKETGYLFDKSVVVDLYREYAHKRASVPIKEYLEGVIIGLTGPLKGVVPDYELSDMRELLEREVLNDQVLAGIQAEMSVAPMQSTAISNPNREVTRVQYRQQERRAVREMSNVQEQQNVNEYMRQVENYRKKSGNEAEEIRFELEAVQDPIFGTPNPNIDFASAASSEVVTISFNSPQAEEIEPSATVWSLGQAVQNELAGVSVAFDDRLMTTSNAAMFRTGRSDLMGPYRKASAPVLLVRDGNSDWKAILCSDEDAIQMDTWIRNNKLKLPEDREMFLVRSNGKRISSTTPRDDTFLENPEVQTLLLQAMFFEGDYKTLSRNPWSKPLEKWLTSIEGEERAGLANFFEKHAL